MDERDIRRIEEAAKTAEKLGLLKKLWRAIKKALVKR